MDEQDNSYNLSKHENVDISPQPENLSEDLEHSQLPTVDSNEGNLSSFVPEEEMEHNTLENDELGHPEEPECVFNETEPSLYNGDNDNVNSSEPEIIQQEPVNLSTEDISPHVEQDNMHSFAPEAQPMEYEDKHPEEPEISEFTFKEPEPSMNDADNENVNSNETEILQQEPENVLTEEQTEYTLTENYKDKHPEESEIPECAFKETEPPLNVDVSVQESFKSIEPELIKQEELGENITGTVEANAKQIESHVFGENNEISKCIPSTLTQTATHSAEYEALSETVDHDTTADYGIHVVAEQMNEDESVQAVEFTHSQDTERCLESKQPELFSASPAEYYNFQEEVEETIQSHKEAVCSSIPQTDETIDQNISTENLEETVYYTAELQEMPSSEELSKERLDNCQFHIGELNTTAHFESSELLPENENSYWQSAEQISSSEDVHKHVSTEHQLNVMSAESSTPTVLMETEVKESAGVKCFKTTEQTLMQETKEEPTKMELKMRERMDESEPDEYDENDKENEPMTEAEKQAEFEYRYAQLLAKYFPTRQPLNSTNRNVRCRTLEPDIDREYYSVMKAVDLNAQKRRAATLERDGSTRKHRPLPKPAINDDHLYPESVTPSKVENRLSAPCLEKGLPEGTYDVPYIDDDAFLPRKLRTGENGDYSSGDDSDSGYEYGYQPEFYGQNGTAQLANIDECMPTPQVQMKSQSKPSGKGKEIKEPRTSKRSRLLRLCGCTRRQTED